MQLQDLAQVVRSKNAGPRRITLDVIFCSDAAYQRATQSDDTPAELSVLVHEVVHHFQNVLRLKYECPQEREKLAYIAQDRWLALFGHSLESDFHMDAFSLLVKTQCFW